MHDICRDTVEQTWSDAAVAALTHHLDVRPPLRHVYIHKAADLQLLSPGELPAFAPALLRMYESSDAAPVGAVLFW